ncbi:MAG: calcium/sodium antiporter [Candidatus Aenigmarchaeota archaeon]|nr:calcium/sodium antiporter [Candidatus Aenigmarchaeota archaeon]
MTLPIDLLMFALGIVLLLKGASLFTENASRIAKSLGVSDIVIGLTLVAFTTSLPELSVSTLSVIRGSSGLALGNIIGSNIANIGLVLGISAFLTSSIPGGKAELKQGYIMLAVTVVAALFIIDGLSFLKGAILVSMLLLYVYYLSRDRSLREGIVERIIERESFPKGLALCILGGAGVILGSELLINSSVSMARSFSISETVIGLTIVAVGTSLPELATSVTAAFKRLQGIALGNILGSNIFNLLMVLGASAMAGPIIVESMLLVYSIPMMLLLTALLVLFMKAENKLGRFDGIALLLLYGFFLYLKIFLL